MKITYKYSRNNAQFLYDLSSTSSIDQLVRRLTGRQTVTNDNGEKEHVDPAFSVDEILIDSVEVFNRAEHETVYDNVDKLRAPWDDTENKELFIIPGASHTDLYDGGGKGAIPFDKLELFFSEYLK